MSTKPGTTFTSKGQYNVFCLRQGDRFLLNLGEEESELEMLPLDSGIATLLEMTGVEPDIELWDEGGKKIRVQFDSSSRVIEGRGLRDLLSPLVPTRVYLEVIRVVGFRQQLE